MTKRATAKLSFHIFPAGDGYGYGAVDAKGEPCVIGQTCATRGEAVTQVMKVAPFGTQAIHFDDEPKYPAFAAICGAMASGASAH